MFLILYGVVHVCGNCLFVGISSFRIRVWGDFFIFSIRYGVRVIFGELYFGLDLKAFLVGKFKFIAVKFWGLVWIVFIVLFPFLPSVLKLFFKVYLNEFYFFLTKFSIVSLNPQSHFSYSTKSLVISEWYKSLEYSAKSERFTINFELFRNNLFVKVKC